MSELTVTELQAKIEQVTADLTKLQSSGANSRQLEVMAEYKSYLEDELKMLKNEKAS